MKNRFAVIGLVLAASTISFGFAAQAGVVNFTENPAGDLDMGNVAPGQTGTITNPVKVSTIPTNPAIYGDTGTVNGVLGNNEEIIFTYVYGGPNYLSSSLESNIGSQTSGIYSDTTTPPTENVTLGGLVLATANLTSTGGTTTLTNTSGTSQSFFSSVAAYFKTLGSNVTLTYSVAAVPLPASLVLFGSAVLAMFGFSWFKRKNAAVSA